jgi:hypothetical protein
MELTITNMIISKIRKSNDPKKHIKELRNLQKDIWIEKLERVFAGLQELGY